MPNRHPSVTVTDTTRRNELPTGRVTVTLAPDAEVTDSQVAVAAGYSHRHWGYAVERHDDGTATVLLWND